MRRLNGLERNDTMLQRGCGVAASNIVDASSAVEETSGHCASMMFASLGYEDVLLYIDHIG